MKTSLELLMDTTPETAPAKPQDPELESAERELRNREQETERARAAHEGVVAKRRERDAEHAEIKSRLATEVDAVRQLTWWLDARIEPGRAEALRQLQHHGALPHCEAQVAEWLPKYLQCKDAVDLFSQFLSEREESRERIKKELAEFELAHGLGGGK